MAKKQRSYTVGRIADDKLAMIAEITSRSKGAVIEELVNEASKARGIYINMASLVDPEKEYPVTYTYHPKRGRGPAPASGKLLGKNLTAPQIEQLYQDGLI